MKGATIAFLLFASANAICPNDCSGHGDCSRSSHCTCYHNWMGADCAQRVCTFGRAFVDSPIGDLDGDGAFNPARAFDPRSNFVVHGINKVSGDVGELGLNRYGYARASRITPHDEAHFYRECSNKGLCDRETGLCECFPGYEGSGCRRAACPDNCNGNGVCRTILESDHLHAQDYSAWDGEKTQLCVCDPGWTGPSCSQRSCPKGADPVLYNYKVTDSVQGIYFRTFVPDKNHVKSATRQQEFLADKPSKVHFTVTFKDEYNDEWTTSLMSVDYTSFCDSDPDNKHGICISTPTLGIQTNNPQNGPARTVLERVSEALNTSLLALPTDAIPTSYVWSAGNPLFAVCDGKTALNTNNNLRDDIKKCIDTKKTDTLQLKGAAFQSYPWAANEKDNNNVEIPPKSVYVDSLETRLDMQITKQVDFDDYTIDFDGTDTAVFGLGLFVRLPAPGVHHPLEVRYFYTPESQIGDKTIKYAHVDGKTSGFTDKDSMYLKQELVVVEDLQSQRVWNHEDGEASKTFATITNQKLPYCSNRGICDFESGICNCFSGYTGLRCDTQNAVTYSY